MPGKGDRPRHCFSKKFKQNFDEVDWKSNNKSKIKHKKNGRTIISYTNITITE